jgi:hypothetical protein
MRASAKPSSAPLPKPGPRRKRPPLKSPYIVPMISRAFEILEVLRSGSRLSIDEISLSTGIAKSSVYRIMRTFLAYGHVSRLETVHFVLARQKELPHVGPRIERIKMGAEVSPHG